MFTVISKCEENGRRYVYFDSAPAEVKEIILDGFKAPNELENKELLAYCLYELAKEKGFGNVDYKTLSLMIHSEETLSLIGYPVLRNFYEDGQFCIECLPQTHIQKIMDYAQKCALENKDNH